MLEYSNTRVSTSSKHELTIIDFLIHPAEMKHCRAWGCANLGNFLYVTGVENGNCSLHSFALDLSIMPKTED